MVDGSTYGTSGMLADLTTPYRLNVICQENSGQGAARNRGIYAATGRYCLFLDDDMKAYRGLVAHTVIPCGLVWAVFRKSMDQPE